MHGRLSVCMTAAEIILKDKLAGIHLKGYRTPGAGLDPAQRIVSWKF